MPVIVFALSLKVTNESGRSQIVLVRFGGRSTAVDIVRDLSATVAAHCPYLNSQVSETRFFIG